MSRKWIKYGSKEELLDPSKYRLYSSNPRWFGYIEFISSNITTENNILSIASGSSIVESILKEKGYAITTSDIFGIYDNDMVIDIVSDDTDENYDCVIILGSLYQFDDQQFKNVICNLSKKIHERGYAIIDAGMSPPSIFNWLWHCVWLPIEERFFHGSLCVSRDFGYFRTELEIVCEFATNNLVLVKFDVYSGWLDFNRGHIMPFIMKNSAIATKFFDIVGRYILPYQRMYLFKKV